MPSDGIAHSWLGPFRITSEDSAPQACRQANLTRANVLSSLFSGDSKICQLNKT